MIHTIPLPQHQSEPDELVREINLAIFHAKPNVGDIIRVGSSEVIYPWINLPDMLKVQAQ